MASAIGTTGPAVAYLKTFHLPSGAVMECAIYKGQRKADTYLYIEREGDFSRVPSSLISMLGPLQLVMRLALTPGRKLAQADADEVQRLLVSQGYYLQMPPQDNGGDQRRH